MNLEQSAIHTSEQAYAYPEEVSQYQQRLEALLADDAQMNADPVLEPLIFQLQNHLKHVSYSFRVAGKAEDYPYDLQREIAFPEVHTAWALKRTDRLFDLLNSEDTPVEPSLYFSAELGVDARQKQDELVRDMLNNPLATYDDFTARRERDGFDASFPEIGWTIKALASDMVLICSIN